MLDTATKRRIDDCRDILVGKLPDPKAQIEQITIGLIYKFMNDMDTDAVELGGQAKFFVDYKIPDSEFPNDRSKDKIVEFTKYAWDNLINPKVTAVEMLALYSEAIGGMDKNPNIPQLFRDIFKNAYLPYRDPETLKMFLKTIAEFEYTHSEKLGDAFEYLLSVMGSQGDAGQFRTPRHIIDFLVAIVDPGKNHTILDPACGTAGFLISAFKHIKEKNSDELTPDERRKLIKNFVGYDISPDMVRLSLVNLYLHGFSDPHIYEYDTLSSEERWNESFDVILANPPFMSPKGGIRPHKKFSITSNRSEVLFVDYIAEHLNPKGKAGIIVPEGIIFQSGTAYKELRKMLVDNYLYAVVSLPAGVFNPYSGVKTSILLIDKEVSRKRDEILFVNIENDGYNLGSQRAAIKGGQLDEAVALIHEFSQTGYCDSLISHIVSKSEIVKQPEYSLSGDKYKKQNQLSTEYPVINFEDSIEKVSYSAKIKNSNYKDFGRFPVIDQSDSYIAGYWDNEKDVFKTVKPITIFGDHTRCFKYVDFDFVLGADGVKILQPIDKYNPLFYYFLIRDIPIKNLGYSRHFKELKGKKIPLPPLAIQNEIASEIKNYQRIIDGGKAVVGNYKPEINIKEQWDVVTLGDYISTQTGGTPSKAVNEYWEGTIPWVSPKDMKSEFIYDAEDHISEEAVKNSSTKILPTGSILIVVRSGILKHSLPIAMTMQPVCFNQDILAIQSTSERLLNKYLFYLIKSTSETHIREGIKPGVTVQSFHNGYFKKLKIPLPSVEVQGQIISAIEKEQELVNSNSLLIRIFEQKIKDRIAKVWGD